MAEQDSGAAASDSQQAAELLPVVYAELRRLAVAMSGRLPPGQTLQPTPWFTRLTCAGRRH